MQFQSSNPAVTVARKNVGEFNFSGKVHGSAIQDSISKAITFVTLALIVCVYIMQDYINDWYFFFSNFRENLILAAIATIAVAIITIFKPHTSPITAPIYAVLLGYVLGNLSGMFEFIHPSIVNTAILSSFSVELFMLVLWKFKIISPTKKLKAVIIGAITGFFALYIVSILCFQFRIYLIPQFGFLPLIISLIICPVVALCLILDFDSMQQSVDAGLPKYFEYFNAFSLLLTICWLYVGIFILLAKLKK